MVNLNTIRAKLILLIVLSVGILTWVGIQSYSGLKKIKSNLDSVAIQELGLNKRFVELSVLQSKQKSLAREFLISLRQYKTLNDRDVLNLRKEYASLRTDIFKIAKSIDDLLYEMSKLIIPSSQFAEIAMISIESFKDENSGLYDQFFEVDKLIAEEFKSNQKNVDYLMSKIIVKQEQLINSFVDEVDEITRSSKGEIINDYKRTIQLSIVAYGLIFLFLTGLAIFVYKRVLSPLELATQIAKKLAKGQRDVVIKPKGKDEIATLLNAMNIMQSSINEFETDIIEQRDKALLADQTKTAFLSNVNHEMRTPMNIILGLLEEIQGRLPNDQHAHYINKIHAQSSSLVKLIDEVLDLTEIESGNIEKHVEVLDFNKFIEEQVAKVKTRVKSRGLSLNYTPCGQLESDVLIDAVKVSKILSNIIDNSLKFTHEGSIDISTRVNTNFLEVCIEDTGIGIDEKVRMTMFDDFVQGEDYLQKKYEGLGLGLVVSKKLIDIIGGKIEVDSVVGEGTIVKVSIPLKYLEQKQSQSPQKNVDLKSLKVLAVDDNEENLNLIKIQLSKTVGYIDYAQDGSVALDKFVHGEYDVILMDLQMPVMDGVTCVELMRKHEESKSITKTPVIAVTAYALEAERKKCENAGFDKFYTKPINKKELIGLIKDVTANKNIAA